MLTGRAKGVRIKIDIRCESAYWLGSYDRKIINDICDLVCPGWIVWDCGAYLGYYTAAMRNTLGVNGAVHCFEASRENFNRLSLLPVLNGWSNVHVHNLAVGPDHSSIRFATNQGAASGPVDMPEKAGFDSSVRIEEVKSVGLDELGYETKLPLPHFIKMDLETAEVYALRNGHRLFTERRPVVLVELHKNKDSKAPPAFIAAEEFLKKYDYDGMEAHLGTKVETVEDFIVAEKRGIQCTILARPKK